MMGCSRGHFILSQAFTVCLCMWEYDNEMKYFRVWGLLFRRSKIYNCNTNQRTALELMWMESFHE